MMQQVFTSNDPSCNRSYEAEVSVIARERVPDREYEGEFYLTIPEVLGGAPVKFEFLFMPEQGATFHFSLKKGNLTLIDIDWSITPQMRGSLSMGQSVLIDLFISDMGNCIQGIIQHYHNVQTHGDLKPSVRHDRGRLNRIISDLQAGLSGLHGTIERPQFVTRNTRQIQLTAAEEAELKRLCER